MTDSSQQVTVRFLTAADEERWRVLFRTYREFYELEPSEEVVSTTWGWMNDPTHECKALIAEVDGEVLGFAHHRRISSPYTATSAIFLDDLFTDAAARGKGVGRALIERLQRMAGAEGRTGVEWVTADDNHQAQALYDTLAERTTWVTYNADALPVR